MIARKWLDITTRMCRGRGVKKCCCFLRIFTNFRDLYFNIFIYSYWDWFETLFEKECYRFLATILICKFYFLGVLLKFFFPGLSVLSVLHFGLYLLTAHTSSSSSTIWQWTWAFIFVLVIAHFTYNFCFLIHPQHKCLFGDL